MQEIALQRLTEFPYFDNYVDLSRMELSAIHAIKSLAPRKIAFIGSGPLPLSSLCLCKALDKAHGRPGSTTVLNIDNNPQAISQSRALAKGLGKGAQGMEFLCHEVGSAPLDLRVFDVVYLAALVGMTQVEKEICLIEVVKGMMEGALVVIRTAHGLRGLLYPVCVSLFDSLGFDVMKSNADQE
jgi:nicotianamine synthase